MANEHTLNAVFERQRKFSSNFIDFDNLTIEDRQKLTKEFVSLTFVELAEVLNETDYRMHSKKDSPLDIDAIKEELMDVQKYLLNMFLLWQVDPEEWLNLFHDKSKIVEQKFADKQAALHTI